MFENTLLIIKADYIHKRKPVLLHLLQKGFMIQAQRKLLFKPEDAAEFYRGRADEKDFMLQVIVLAKGVSEAFILAKENAMYDLMATMVCYFTVSSQMEQMVHVTRSLEDVQPEISFIFPNYIHEPIPVMVPGKLCTDPLLPSLVGKIYDIMHTSPGDEQRSWKNRLAEWLTIINTNLPIITNPCTGKLIISSADKGLQVGSLKLKSVGNLDDVKGTTKEFEVVERGHTSTSFLSTDSTLAMLSSSSCVTCTTFEPTDMFSCDIREQISPTEVFGPKMIPLPRLEEEHSQESALETRIQECEHVQEWSITEETDMRIHTEATVVPEEYFDELYFAATQAEVEKLYRDAEALNSPQDEMKRMDAESEALNTVHDEMETVDAVQVEIEREDASQDEMERVDVESDNFASFDEQYEGEE